MAYQRRESVGSLQVINKQEKNKLKRNKAGWINISSNLGPAEVNVAKW